LQRKSEGYCVKDKAITAAKIRIARAKEAVSAMEQAKSLRDIETAWTNFLVAAGAIYSVLEQGAKGNGKSEAWFGRAKHTRRTDDLLSYIHHARNSETHTIEGSTRTDFTLIPKDKRVKVHTPPDGGPQQVTLTNDMKPGDAVVEIGPPGIRLMTVRDERYKDSFDPPSKHLEKPIVDRTPIGVARLAIPYLDNLIDDAAAYVQ
jgi:hypothetical protein